MSLEKSIQEAELLYEDKLNVEEGLKTK
jgi:hypothetical protein